MTGERIFVTTSIVGFQFGGYKIRRGNQPNCRAIAERHFLTMFKGVGVPSVAKAEDTGIVGHKVDFEFAQSHAADHVIIWANNESALVELLLKPNPMRITNYVGDKVYIIRIADSLQCGFVGYQQASGSATYKNHLL